MVRLSMDAVALIKVDQNFATALVKGLEIIGGFGSLRSPVIIKPNICTITDNTGYSVTHAQIIDILLDLLFHQQPDLCIKIVESDSQSKWANEAFTKYGYTDLERKYTKKDYNLSLVNLSKCPTEIISFEGAYFTNPEIPNILINPGYFISVAQAKTHYLTSITGVLKNLFGLLPLKTQSYYHPNINEVIVDLNRIFSPNLCIIDARMGVEGWNGPKITPLNTIIMGYKPVSVDAMMAQILGLQPENIQHIVACSRFDLGKLNPQILGEIEGK
ncbi:MAG: DUF362 domain-containing protein [Candidatus Thorarchaeota archaeon]